MWQSLGHVKFLQEASILAFLRKGTRSPPQGQVPSNEVYLKLQDLLFIFLCYNASVIDGKLESSKPVPDFLILYLYIFDFTLGNSKNLKDITTVWIEQSQQEPMRAIGLLQSCR